MRRNAGSLADIAKFSVPLIVIQQMRNGLKGVGVAIASLLDLLGATPDVLFEIAIKVARDNQVESPVAVIIEERRSGRPTAATHSGPVGHVLNCPIALDM